MAGRLRVVIDATIEPDERDAQADDNAIKHLADRLRGEMEKIGAVSIARLIVVEDLTPGSAEAAMLEGFRGR